MNLQGNKTVFTSFRVEECNLILRSEHEVLLRQTVKDGFQRGRQILKYTLLTTQTTFMYANYTIWCAHNTP